MRALCFLIAVSACSSTPGPTKPEPQPEPAAPPVAPVADPPAAAPPMAPVAPVASEKLAADTPRTTVAGNPFIAPAEWSVSVRGPATILEPPEGGSQLALVDVKAASADEALDLAWKAYKPDHAWPLQLTTKAPDKDGWTKISQHAYLTSPNEKRVVVANTLFANDLWTVVIINMATAIAEKRGGQLALVSGQLLPKGFERESFATRKANPLDAARIAELGKFIEAGQQHLGVPGVALGPIQPGKVVLAV